MKSANSYFDAFISYGRADSKSLAARLYQRLSKLGFNIWFDQEDIPLAVDFQEQINNGIEKTHNFIFIISPHSVNSPYCLKEIELAIKSNKRIIPLLHIEKITREIWQRRNPNGSEPEWQEYQDKGLSSAFTNIHPTIGKINWIYFREDLEAFDTSFNGLIGAIEKQAEYTQLHTQYLNFALEWLRNQKRNSYLLTEEARRRARAWLQYKFVDEQAPCAPSDLHCEFIGESVKHAHSLMTQACLCFAKSNLPESSSANAIIQLIRQTLMRDCLIISENKIELQGDSEVDSKSINNILLSDNFICFISRQSADSSLCKKQLGYALECNKRIIFIVVEKVDFQWLSTELNSSTIIDFTNVEALDSF